MFKFLLLSLLLVHTATASNIEYHGYYRAGVGTNSKGGDQTCFNAPNAPGNQFRLGNECTNYGEFSLVMKHLDKDKTGKFFDTHFRLAFNQPGDTNWESANGKDSDGNGKAIAIREAYFRGGNFENSKLIYWAGKRYLRQHDVYMNDWYYFADTNGNGAGIEGFKIFKGNAKLSYLKETHSDLDTNIGKVATTHFDLRVLDIPLQGSHFLNIWLDYATRPSSNDGSGVFYASQKGHAIGLLLDTKLQDGFNHFAIVYGKGIMGSFNLGGNGLNILNSNKHIQEDKAYTYRFVEHYTKKFSSHFKTHFAASFVYKRPKDKSTSSKTKFVNLGISPIYFFDDHYFISGVLGHSYYKAQNYSDQNFTRLTIAPGVSINSSIWARPVLKFFYTKSLWSNSLKGKVGGSVYSTSTSGSNFGFQGEAWF